MILTCDTSRMPHPGYEWTIGPASDWSDAPAPFVWVAYRMLGNGIAERIQGFASTLDEARSAAQAHVEDTA